MAGPKKQTTPLSVFPPPIHATPAEALSWAERKAPDLQSIVITGIDHQGELVVLYGDLMDRRISIERGVYLLERAKQHVMSQDAGA